MAMVSSSSSATVAVDKATSDLLIGPDWTMNMDICDSINSNHWLPKDVVKAVKKRLQHKNPRVQLLSLTLLETMVKNCGDYVHFQIAEKNILGEMVKIVKKKSDMHVRDKILVLLDAWQEAFGGPGGKHPQYYWAYEELRRSGVEFPQRSLDTAPIFTPPVTNPTLRPAQAGYGMPSDSSRRLDETMATEIEGLSMSSLDSMRIVMDLLGDMLQAVNPAGREAVKDEIIVDLVERCRSNQKKLMQMLTTTGDEELLGRGLELNDSLQVLLAKHDAIASGSPMPSLLPSSSSKPSEGRSSDSKLSEVRDSSPKATAIANTTKSQIDEEEEEEDDFAQLARRHSKPQSSPVQATTESAGALVLVESSSATSSVPTAATATPSNALALADPPAPVRTTKEQDIIDLLSLTLSTTSSSQNPETPQTPPSSNENMPENEVPSATQGNPYAPQTYPGNQGQVPYNSYVVPWAQPQVQHQFHPSALPHQQFQSFPETQQPLLHQQQMQTLSQPHLQSQPQPQLQSQPQPQLQSQYPQYTTGYPPPPWAATPGYANNQNYSFASSNMFSNPRANLNAYSSPAQAGRPLQHYNSFPTRVDPQVNSGASNPTTPGGQKPFIPSYRLFEDLNVLGSADRRLSGSSGQSMVGGRKY